MLDNVKHERFAAAYAVHGNAAQAYREAGYAGKDADSHGARLMGNDSIRARIEEIRKTAHDVGGAAVLSLLEKRIYLARVVRTAIRDVDECSDLCQSVKYTIMGGPKGKLRRGSADEGNEEVSPEMTLVEVKMPDKLAAIKIDNEMSGDNAPVKISGTLSLDQLFPGASFLPESIPPS